MLATQCPLENLEENYWRRLGSAEKHFLRAKTLKREKSHLKHREGDEEGDFKEMKITFKAQGGR